MSEKKNYKVIENRSRLTPEQVKAGKNFNSIKNSIPAVKKVFPKWMVIVAGAVGIIVVASVLFVYFNNNGSNDKPLQSIPADTISPVVPLVDTITDKNKNNSSKKSSENTSVASKKIIQAQNPIEKKNEKVDAASSSSISPVDKLPVEPTLTSNENKAIDSADSAQLKPNVSAQANATVKTETKYLCSIWKPKSFCDVPDSAVIPYATNCDGCDFAYMNCKDVDKMKGVGVWLTVTNKRLRFLLKSHFENITLIRARDGKRIHPFAIWNLGIDRKNKYFGSDFKTTRMMVSFHKKIVLILLFAEAEVGDKIIVDEVVEAEIQK